MDRHEFVTALRILISIDSRELPQLDSAQARMFSDDPFRFLLRASGNTADAIWALVERRQVRRAA